MAGQRRLTKRQRFVYGSLAVGLAAIVSAAFDGNVGARITYVLGAGVAALLVTFAIMDALCRRGFLVKPAAPGDAPREGWAAIWPATLGVVASGFLSSVTDRGYPEAIGLGVAAGSIAAIARNTPALAEKRSDT
jgi:hypothetical protein